MKKIIFICILIYTAFVFGQKEVIFDGSIYDKLFPCKHIKDSDAGIVINLWYHPSFDVPEMLIIEYNSSNSFKVRYIYTLYGFQCALDEGKLDNIDSYIDFAEFTSRECPNFSKYIKTIYKILIPSTLNKIDPGKYIFTEASVFSILIESDSDSIEVSRIGLNKKSENKIRKIFKEAWKCLERKYETKKKK